MIKKILILFILFNISHWGISQQLSINKERSDLLSVCKYLNINNETLSSITYPVIQLSIYNPLSAEPLNTRLYDCSDSNRVRRIDVRVRDTSFFDSKLFCYDSVLVIVEKIKNLYSSPNSSFLIGSNADLKAVGNQKVVFFSIVIDKDNVFEVLMIGDVYNGGKLLNHPEFKSLYKIIVVQCNI
jgi:hypothetical protein